MRTKVEVQDEIEAHKADLEAYNARHTAYDPATPDEAKAHEETLDVFVKRWTARLDDLEAELTIAK